MMPLVDIGHQLVEYRRALGVSQRELGQRLGVTQPQIARWEANAYRSASLQRVGEVAAALGLEHAPAQPIAADQAATYDVAVPGTDAEAAHALSRLTVVPGVIAAFARSHHITRLELFGSVLGDGFGPASDVDVLVTYEPGHTPSLLDLADHEVELSALLRRPVDLVSRAGVEASSNERRKRQILTSAKTLYARP